MEKVTIHVWENDKGCWNAAIPNYPAYLRPQLWVEARSRAMAVGAIIVEDNAGLEAQVTHENVAEVLKREFGYVFCTNENAGRDIEFTWDLDFEPDDEEKLGAFILEHAEEMWIIISDEPIEKYVTLFTPYF